MNIEDIVRKMEKVTPVGTTNLPATEQEIVSLEGKYQVKLPDEVRQFLLLHNGWDDRADVIKFPSTSELMDDEQQRGYSDYLLEDLEFNKSFSQKSEPKVILPVYGRTDEDTSVAMVLQNGKAEYIKFEEG